MKRLFVTEIDTPLSRRIVERFGLTKEFEIFGTLRRGGSAANRFEQLKAQQADSEVESASESISEFLRNELPYVTAVVSGYADDAQTFKSTALECDIVVCPLKDSILEAEALVKMLAHTSCDTEKTFVLVSSVLTWANTEAAQRAEALAEKQRERQAAIDAGEEVPADDAAEGGEEEEVERPVFTDDRYHGRVPHARYQHWRDLEQLTKQANSESLHTHVVFSGLTYGRDGGDDAGFVHDLFRSAWHAQPLPIPSVTTNVLPLIHVDDLSHVVFKIGNSYDLIPQRYIIATDKGNHTIGAIVKAVNDAMGCGETRVIPASQMAVTPDSAWLTADLRMEPGAAFEILEESEWVAAEGFVAAIDRVTDEFRKYRGLQPLRVAVIGPPKSGKSTLSQHVSSLYRIPRLSIADIIADYTDHLDTLTSTLQKARLERREAKKAQAAEELRRAAAEMKAAAAGGEEGGEGAALNAAGDDADDADGNAAAAQGGADGEANRAAAAAAAFAETVSDIDFDDAADIAGASQLGGANAESGEDGDNTAVAASSHAAAEHDSDVAAAGGGAAAAEEEDPEEAEDERISKLKEDIALAKRVLAAKVKVTVNFNNAPRHAAAGDAAGGADDDAGNDDAADGEEGAKDGDAAADGTTAADGGASPAVAAPVNPFVRYRFADEPLAVMARWSLSRKVCRNQGYILDGFPKTVKQATLVFGTNSDITIPELPDPADASGDGSGGAGDGAGASGSSPFLEDPSTALNPVDEKLFPNSVITLSATNLALLLSRSKADEGKDVTVDVPPHDSVANTLRRLNLFATHHTDAPCTPSGSLITWFKSVLTAAAEGAAAEGPNPYAVPPRGASILEVDAGRFQALFDTTIQYIRDFVGAPHFYRPTPEDIVASAVEAEVRLETARLEALRAEEEREREVQRQRDAALVELQRHQRRFSTVEKEKSEAAAVMSETHMTMHSYLLQFVVPTLTEAMERTAVLRPEDPIDTLAEILFHHVERHSL